MTAPVTAPNTQPVSQPVTTSVAPSSPATTVPVSTPVSTQPTSPHASTSVPPTKASSTVVTDSLSIGPPLATTRASVPVHHHRLSNTGDQVGVLLAIAFLLAVIGALLMHFGRRGHRG